MAFSHAVIGLNYWSLLSLMNLRTFIVLSVLRRGYTGSCAW